MAVWLQAKIRESQLGLRPRLYTACLWRQHRLGSICGTKPLPFLIRISTAQLKEDSHCALVRLWPK